MAATNHDDSQRWLIRITGHPLPSLVAVAKKCIILRQPSINELTVTVVKKCRILLISSQLSVYDLTVTL